MGINTYVGLSDAERSEIEILKSKGYSCRKIAVALGRSPNTVSREIRVNTVSGEYTAKTAKAKSRVSRRSRRFQWQKIEQFSELRSFIITRLAPPYDWGPNEISGYLKHRQTRVPYVSAPQIYAWLRSARGQPYCQYLYSKRYHQKKRKNKTERVMIPDRISMTERPVAASDRSEAGHWEYDSVVSGKPRGAPISTFALAVTQERVTRLIAVTVVGNLRPEPYAKVIASMVDGYAVRTMTTDNGIENKQHRVITSTVTGNPAVYFTDPYSSWQKGGVENANKMLRRYFPKGTNFANITQATVDRMVSRINNKPRQSLGYKSAIECVQEKGLLLSRVSY